MHQWQAWFVTLDISPCWRENELCQRRKYPSSSLRQLESFRALWHLFLLCFCVNRVIFMQVCCLCNECQENWWHLRPSTFPSISLFFWVAILEISVPPLLAGERRQYPLSLVAQDSKRGSIWKSLQFQFWTVRHGTNLVYAWCALGAFHCSLFPPPLCLVYWFFFSLS